MKTELSVASGNQPATGGTETQNPVEVETLKQPEVAENDKMRKGTDSRSKVWQHFHKMFEEGKLVKARCIYCAKIVHADSKINGTSSCRSHMLRCNKNPNPKSSRQSLLTLQPDVHSSDNVGVIGSWSFDQEAIRNALANMVIVDELPFKFVEAEGFK